MDGRPSCAPAWCGTTRSTASIAASPFGGFKESGFGREGGRQGLRTVPALPTARSSKGDRRAYRSSKDLQAVRRWWLSRAVSRAVATSRLGCAEASTSPRGSRKDLRDAVVAARKAQGWVGRSHRPTTVGRSSTVIAEMMATTHKNALCRRDPRLCTQSSAAAKRRKEVREMRPTSSPGTPVSPTSCQSLLGCAERRQPARSSTSPPSSLPGVIGVVAPTATHRACSVLLAVTVAAARRRQRRCGAAVSEREASPLPGLALGEVVQRRQRRPGGRGQPAGRASAASWCRSSPATGTSMAC